MNHNDALLAVAKAEDTQDLLNHIAWTDVIRPQLEKQVKQCSDLLVQEALGGQLPPGRTREQIAGMAFGVQYIVGLLERILKDGERGLLELRREGLDISTKG